ncbi:MAG: ATP-dependent RecD-like DNA helicase [Lachnospiraceae bacterium]|nr:ATP-dependent RecD-like DNA helicase [Lachnospiraceae bacterium]
MEIVSGYIDHITFQNEENGYTVMKVMTEKGGVVCVGAAGGFGEGETVEVEGEYIEHPTYGKQLRISSVRPVAPTDKVSVLRYLGSGTIKGVGPKLAERIVERFGDDTMRVMEEEPERLAEIKGISGRMARAITDQMLEKKGQRALLIFVQQYGLSRNLTLKLIERYGDEIYSVLKSNPYRMVEEIPSVGFKTADDIAAKSGIVADSEYRVRSCIVYVLKLFATEGHCYVPKAEVLEETIKLLGLETGSGSAVMEDCIRSLSADRQIVMRDDENGGTNIYLEYYDRIEKACARQLWELKNGFESMGRYAGLSVRAEEEGIELDGLQKKAVEECLKNGVFILSGGPGTGKTTTINTIIAELEDAGENFVLAAPTGRAAKRMTEATSFEAQTIHRLLEISGEVADGDSRTIFARNRENPLETDTVIVDEASMLDISLLKSLLDAMVPGMRLILVGDVDQLPSVGPGQVLRDVMESDAFACVKLDRVFRQAGESHIVSYAHMINEGKHMDLSVKYPDFFLLEKETIKLVHGYLAALCMDVIPRKLGLGGNDVQILTPMRKGPLGVEGLNRMLQEQLNPPKPFLEEVIYGDTVFREGDKVMQIRNDYNLEWEIRGDYDVSLKEGKGIFNGDVGVVKNINKEYRIVEVLFDDGRLVYYPVDKLEELELSYAVTIHKSQGSEYPVVILPILDGPKMLFNRNLLYTAVTRAKQCVIIVGSGQKVMEMIDTDSELHRYTSLRQRLIETEEIFG